VGRREPQKSLSAGDLAGDLLLHPRPGRGVGLGDVGVAGDRLGGKGVQGAGDQRHDTREGQAAFKEGVHGGLVGAVEGRPRGAAGVDDPPGQGQGGEPG